MGEPSSGVLPPMRSPDDVLDSWKEIAAYFHRDIKTVQRWEKREGMPVHRHLHDRIGSVPFPGRLLGSDSQGSGRASSRDFSGNERKQDRSRAHSRNSKATSVRKAHRVWSAGLTEPE